MPADRMHDGSIPSGPMGTPRPPKPAGPALQRNQACLTCRSRKVKCDATKPACGACRKTALVRHEDPNLLICQYDEPTEEGETPKTARAKNAQKVSFLENKVAELENLIRGVPNPALPVMGTFPTYSTPPQANASTIAASSSGIYGTVPVPSFSSTQPMFDILTSTSSSNNNSYSAGAPSPMSMLNTFEKSGNLDSGSLPDLLGTRKSSSGFTPQPTFSMDTSMDESFFTLLYPSWPPDLPSPSLVQSLCDVYFASKSCAVGMVNQARFMTSLTLPPTHSQFPSTALIHAICGVACLFNVRDPLELEKETYWTADVSPAEYHLKLAKVHIDDAMVRGRKLFQVAQAIVLVCFCSYSQARFVEVWLYTSLATRISTPLGLNHLEGNCQSAQTPDGAVTVVKPALLDPPIDEIERYERAVTFWLAICCDRFASSNTGWAQSLAEDDITTLLPNEQTATSTSMPSIEHHDCLDIRSPSFLSSHPPQIIRSQGMLIKSMVLLSRINCFLQRAPFPIGHRTVAKATQHVPDLRDTPSFKRLDADSVAFRLSFPRDLRNAFKKDAHGMIDSNLVLAHQVAHAATILLHEAWCTAEPNDPSMQRCMSSAKAILAYLVHENAAELALLNPFITHTWSIAGRTLVREMAIQEQQGNAMIAAQVKGMIERVLIGLTETARSPLSLTCAGQLRTLLSDPAKTLPKFGVPMEKCTDVRPEKTKILFDETAPAPLLQPGRVPGVNLGPRPPKLSPTLAHSAPSQHESDSSVATPGSLDALEATNSFLLELEQDQAAKTAQPNGKDLSAEQIRSLLEPWASGSAPSPSAEQYWSMLSS